MEHIIKVAVRDKIAVAPRNAMYICGNSDFVIEFDFDDEWQENKGKLARFIWNGEYQDVAFANNRCPVPVIFDAYSFRVGVYAGNLETTTAALVSASKSILCGTEAPAPALPSVYEQLEALFAQGIDVAWEHANAATEAAGRAEASETAAKNAEEAAAAHEKSAMQSKESAATSESNAAASESKAAASERAAKLSEDNAKKSEQTTAQNEQLLSDAVNSAAASAQNAQNAESKALQHSEAADNSSARAIAAESNASAFASAAKQTASEVTNFANSAGSSMLAAKSSADAAATSEKNAKTSERNAGIYADNAAAQANVAKLRADDALAFSVNATNSASLSIKYAEAAKESANKADGLATTAAEYAAVALNQANFSGKHREAASGHEEAAGQSANSASASAAAAKQSEDAAAVSEASAAASAEAAQKAAESVRDGEDGITPHIGDNGNWYIGDTDTGKPSRGEDGTTPHIGANGNWFIGDVDTGIAAGGSGGGSAAQSDWNAAEGEPGHVLNRTHYTEGQEAVVVLPETMIETPPDNDYTAMLEPFELVEGRSYVVAWNGVEYECSCFTGMGYLMLGNFASFGMTGNDEPFALMIADGMCIVMAIDGSETATISVTASAFEIVHKLEVKYLPEGVPYSEVNSEVILPETTAEVVDYGDGVAGAGAGIENPGIHVETGKTYTVTYNGVEYQCEAIVMEVDTGVFVGYLGNIGAMGMGEDTGEPFAIAVIIGAYIEIMVLDGSTTVTISIVANNEIVNKIDVKYLPDGLPFAEPFDDVVFSDFPAYSDMYVISPAITMPIAGYVYDVNWGGTIYECTARAYDNGMPLILLGSGLGFDERDAHFPFTIALLETPTNGLCGFIRNISEIEGTEFYVVGKYKVNKLNERCLPDIPKTLVVTFTKVDGEYVPDIEQEIAWQTCADGGMVYAKIPAESNNGHDFIPLSGTRNSLLLFIMPIYYTGGWYYHRQIEWRPSNTIGTKVTETLTRWNLSTLS